MLKTLSNFFDKLLRKYTPDSFVLAIFITTLTLILALVYTEASIKDLTLYWGNGFWSLLPFTMQITMVFVGGSVLSSTPLVQTILRKVAHSLKTPHQAVYVVSLFAFATCWMNWGFGLVFSGLLCRAVIKAVPHTNFRLLVAGAYSGFLMSQGGMSGSIPLTIATEGNFNQAAIGGLIPVTDTIFSSFNLIIVTSMMATIPLMYWYLSRLEGPSAQPYVLPEPPAPETPERHTLELAERLEYTSILPRALGGFGVFFMILKCLRGEWSLELNSVCFLLLFLAILLHKNVRNFVRAVNEACGLVGSIILQFPFYAGIMGILQNSGLATVLSNMFVQIANPDNYGLLTAYSASILNLFIPSGGGKWAVQSPVVIESAKAIGAYMPKACMAVAWGGACGNMLQPFWALPLLAIAGLKVRDIMGYCILSFIVAASIVSVVFVFM